MARHSAPFQGVAPGLRGTFCGTAWFFRMTSVLNNGTHRFHVPAPTRIWGFQFHIECPLPVRGVPRFAGFDCFVGLLPPCFREELSIVFSYWI